MKQRFRPSVFIRGLVAMLLAMAALLLGILLAARLAPSRDIALVLFSILILVFGGVMFESLVYISMKNYRPDDNQGPSRAELTARFARARKGVYFSLAFGIAVAIFRQLSA